MKRFFDTATFNASALLIFVFVVLGLQSRIPLGSIFITLQDLIASWFSSFYLLSVSFFLLFVIWLSLSRYGSVKLGSDREEPRYSWPTWFSMLFSAGMGIGLLFYSVAEPVAHYAHPLASGPQTATSAREAMKITFFHWGLHAWSIYLVVGLALAYFSYRQDQKLTLRSALFGLRGKKINNSLGLCVDVLAVFATLFGMATSLGLGAIQIGAGLDFLGLAESSRYCQVTLIVAITFVATISVVTGIDRGIRRLSEVNVILGLLLLAFVLINGPTSKLLTGLLADSSSYLSDLSLLSFGPDGLGSTQWKKDWTLFYWSWWITWSPFVGLFIARISRGRTVRELVAGVLLVPTALTFLWLSVFGGTALEIEATGKAGIIAAVEENLPTALFTMLANLPLAELTSLAAMVVIATFFITSSDSASLVIDIITSNGDPDPSIGKRMFWAITEGIVAIVLLLTGGLIALQTAVITTALPFCAVLLLICFSLWRALRRERSERKTEN